MPQAVSYDFEWDPRKAASNSRKHGVTFEQAAQAFLDHLALTVYDELHSDYEERWYTLGMDKTGVLLAVSHTYKVTSATTATVRIISARSATKREQVMYSDEPH